jgi:hypothetical protein
MDSNFLNKLCEVNIVTIFIACLPETDFLSLRNKLKGAMAWESAHRRSIATSLEVPPQIIGMEGEFAISRLIERIGVEGSCWEEGARTARSHQVKRRSKQAI